MAVQSFDFDFETESDGPDINTPFSLSPSRPIDQAKPEEANNEPLPLSFTPLTPFSSNISGITVESPRNIKDSRSEDE